MESVSALVAGLCDGLMVAAPGHPVQDVFRVPDWWCEDERPEDSDEFGAGQRDETGRSGRDRRGCGSSGQGEDSGRGKGEQRPAHPGVPAGHLSFVQAGEGLAELGRVGRAARCQVCWSFSAQPPSEPDGPAFQASGSPVTTA